MPPETELKTIVIVEDDVAMREIVTHKLSASGFVVKEAEDGKAGIDLIVETKPSLVLLDLMLPEVDGFAVLETIRKHKDPEIANTPIIILSNLWSNKDILKTKALHVQAYLVKAYFTTEEILKKVQEVLANPEKFAELSVNNQSGGPPINQ
ncbi:TPA: response regulator [Patescibacteria group bacterium]|jgi:DNA-binding response OmpR family regulator|nr:response regulator [Patescibacteria group bacterium]